jgi:ribonuclease BN (tRNA processing enzyme)
MTASDFRVTLLGTGVPIPSPDRFGPCTLVEAGDQKFLIDAGRGASGKPCVTRVWWHSGGSCFPAWIPTGRHR